MDWIGLQVIDADDWGPVSHAPIGLSRCVVAQFGPSPPGRPEGGSWPSLYRGVIPCSIRCILSIVSGLSQSVFAATEIR